jgi:predicted RNA binding protein YcfA (HicA-like mRNA interferase family)
MTPSAILAAEGFHQVRQRGSYVVTQQQTPASGFTVAGCGPALPRETG